MRYEYCPVCGSKLIQKNAGDDGAVPYCMNCGRYWFDSFSSCVIVMVVNEDEEIAMLTQNYLSTEYKTFVSGFIKPGETAEETAFREVDEELGLKLYRLEYEGTYWFDERDQLMHAYIGCTKGKEFRLSGEVDAAEWISWKDAPDEMFPDRPGNTQHILYRKYIDLKILQPGRTRVLDNAAESITAGIGVRLKERFGRNVFIEPDNLSHFSDDKDVESKDK